MTAISRTPSAPMLTPTAPASGHRRRSDSESRARIRRETRTASTEARAGLGHLGRAVAPDLAAGSAAVGMAYSRGRALPTRVAGSALMGLIGGVADIMEIPIRLKDAAVAGFRSVKALGTAGYLAVAARIARLRSRNTEPS